MRKRWFIDDEAEPAFAGTENALAVWRFTSGRDKLTLAEEPCERALVPLTGKVTFLGILMVAGAASCLSVLVILLYVMFRDLLMIDYYQQMNSLYIPMQILWIIAAALVLATGIYILRHRRDPAHLLSLHGKVKLAFIIALIGLAIGNIGVVMGFGTVMKVVEPLIIEWYVLLGIALLMPMCSMMEKMLSGKKSSKLGWGILSAVGCFMAASPWMMVALMQGVSME